MFCTGCFFSEMIAVLIMFSPALRLYRSKQLHFSREASNMNVFQHIFQVEACFQNQITPDLSLNQVLNSARTWVHNLLQYLTIIRYPCSNLEFECGTRKPIGACPWPLNRTVWRWRLQHLFAVMKVKLCKTAKNMVKKDSILFQLVSVSINLNVMNESKQKSSSQPGEHLNNCWTRPTAMLPTGANLRPGAVAKRQSSAPGFTKSFRVRHDALTPWTPPNCSIGSLYIMVYYNPHITG